MDSEKSLNLIFIKIRAMGPELFHVDRQSDRRIDGQTDGEIEVPARIDWPSRHISRTKLCSPALSMGEKCYLYSGNGLAYTRTVPSLQRSVWFFE